MSETRFCLECDRKTESGDSYDRAYCRECGSFYDDSEMNDREKKIAEIRETLEKATPGSWKWVDVYKKIDFEKYNMGGFVNEEGKLICHFGNRIDYYPTEGEPPDYYDELLIANAPEWLRFLLSELERMEREYAEERAAHNAHMTELCELEQERNMYKASSEVFYERLKKVDEERDKLIEGLRKLAKTNAENISEIREWKAKQNDPEVIDLDWYNYVARDILKEIGVTVE